MYIAYTLIGCMSYRWYMKKVLSNERTLKSCENFRLAAQEV